MKIINAIWEKENLGVTTSEIQIEKNDKIENCVKSILDLKEEYLVAKVPSDNLECLNALTEYKFKIIETQFSLDYTSKNYALPKLYDRYLKHINVLKADTEDINFVLNNVKTGKMFVTDRISMDTYFGLQKAGNRYYNWMKTLLEHGAEIYVVKYKEDKVGFAMNFKKENNTFNAILGGLFPEFENRGLGFLAIHGNMSSIYEKGGTKVVTAVSSNNMPILRLHLLFGFNIDNIYYVLVKHNN